MVSSYRVGLLVAGIAIAVLAAGSAVTATDLGIAANDTQPEIIQVEGSSNYLSPTSENTSQQRYKASQVDVAGAIATDATRLRGTQAINRYDTRILQGEDSTKVARDIAEAVDVGIEDLSADQRDLYMAYSRDEISDATLLRELARFEAQTSQYRRLAEHARAEPDLPPDLQRKLTGLEVETPLLATPLSSRIENAVSGTGGPVTLYLQSSDDALVLSAIVDDIYVRQATVLDQRATTGQDQFDAADGSPLDAAMNRSATLYPWTVGVDLTPEIQTFGNSSVYLFQSSHAHGEVRSFIDGKTRNVFHEVQFKNPIQVPVSQVNTNTDNDIRLTVESTAPTGPMRVSIVSGEDIEPSEIELSVEGESVGTFDESGNLWTIQPLGSFEVSATTPSGDTVTVSVTVLDS